MNEFADFEAAKPDDVALDAATDARIRRTLGPTDATSGDGAHAETELGGSEPNPVGDLAEAGTRRDDSRRRWAVAASAAAVVIGAVGFVAVAGERDTRPTSDAPGPTLPAPVDPAETPPDPPQTEADVTDTTRPPTSLDGTMITQFETDDLLVEGLRIEVARAVERAGWSFTATEAIPGTPESPGVTMIGANGDARYAFEFRPVESSTDCPVGDWASDLLDDIARRYDGTTAALVDLNGLADSNAIFAGMVLELPPADQPSLSQSIDEAGRGSDMALLVADPHPRASSSSRPGPIRASAPAASALHATSTPTTTPSSTW